MYLVQETFQLTTTSNLVAGEVIRTNGWELSISRRFRLQVHTRLWLDYRLYCNLLSAPVSVSLFFLCFFLRIVVSMYCCCLSMYICIRTWIRIGLRRLIRTHLVQVISGYIRVSFCVFGDMDPYVWTCVGTLLYRVLVLVLVQRMHRSLGTFRLLGINMEYGVRST